MNKNAPTKNILTREEIKKVLRREANADLYSAAVQFAVIALLLIPFFCLGIYVAKFVLLFGIALSAVCAASLAFMLYRLIVALCIARLIGRDGFSVERDTVSRLSRGEIPKNYSEGRYSVDAIYFTRYGRYPTGGTTLEMSSVGDVFYLVILHTKQKKIVFAYHSDRYDYTEPEEKGNQAL